MRIIRNLSIAALAFVATMLVFEGYLQLSEIQTPMETRIDPEIGPAFVSGAKVTRFNEGFYIGGVNEQGFYGPTVPKKEASGERRVLLIGDSFVMGITVFERHHFATLLRQDLNRESQGKVQVLNFGRGDFNFSNMYQYYRDFASTWEHDLALFFVENQDLYPAQQVTRGLYPIVTVEGDSLHIDYSYRTSPEFARYRRMEPIVAHSALFRMAFNSYKMVLRGELRGLILGKFASFLGPRTAHAKVANAKHNRRERVMPPVTRAILRSIAKNPKAVVVLKKSVEPEVYSILNDLGLTTWDLEPTLQALEDQDEDPYYWEVTGKRGHWNQRAHAAIADYLARQIKADPRWQRAQHPSPDGG